MTVFAAITAAAAAAAPFTQEEKKEKEEKLTPGTNFSRFERASFIPATFQMLKKKKKSKRRPGACGRHHSP